MSAAQKFHPTLHTSFAFNKQRNPKERRGDIEQWI